MTNPTPDAALLWARTSFAAHLRLIGPTHHEMADEVLAGEHDTILGSRAEAFRAGQSHDAGLLAALEAVRRQIAQQRGGALYPNDADGFEMALDDIDEAARAAIAAAKGGRDAG